MVFSGESMRVSSPSSKTNQYRDGASVLIAHTDLASCLVAMMERYYASAALEHTSLDYVSKLLYLQNLESTLGSPGILVILEYRS